MRKIIQGVHVGPILFNAGLSLKGTFNPPIYAFYVSLDGLGNQYLRF